MFLSVLKALIFPNQLYEVVFDQEQTDTSVSIRLYGGAILSKFLKNYSFIKNNSVLFQYVFTFNIVAKVNDLS